MINKLIKSDPTINSLMSENDFLSEEFQKLLITNTDLKRENSRLQKRISNLDRQLTCCRANVKRLKPTRTKHDIKPNEK